MRTIYDFRARDIEGNERSLQEWRGQLLLVVNVASRCGFTPQYAGLEMLHRRYGGRGLSVLGFPCDQFGHQEPGDAAQIREFCDLNYQVSFPLFAKVEVNGADAHPLYRWLRSQARGVLGSRAIKWNFTKFLVARDGTVIRRYAPTATPQRIERDLQPLLQAPA